MRYRWLAAILLAALALSITPTAAEVVEVDPRKDPVTTLEQAEGQRLATLQRTAFPLLLSEISPDDTTVLQLLVKPGGNDFDLGFMNINDGSITPASACLESMRGLRSPRPGTSTCCSGSASSCLA